MNPSIGELEKPSLEVAPTNFRLVLLTIFNRRKWYFSFDLSLPTEKGAFCYDLDLRTAKTNHRAKYLGQRSSTVTVRTHTEQTDKMVGKMSQTCRQMVMHAVYHNFLSH